MLGETIIEFEQDVVMDAEHKSFMDVPSDSFMDEINSAKYNSHQEEQTKHSAYYYDFDYLIKYTLDFVMVMHRLYSLVIEGIKRAILILMLETPILDLRWDILRPFVHLDNTHYCTGLYQQVPSAGPFG